MRKLRQSRVCWRALLCVECVVHGPEGGKEPVSADELSLEPEDDFGGHIHAPVGQHEPDAEPDSGFGNFTQWCGTCFVAWKACVLISLEADAGHHLHGSHHGDTKAPVVQLEHRQHHVNDDSD